MKKIFSNKSDWVFLAIGILLFVLAIGILSYSLNFLIKRVNVILDSGLIKTPEVANFNLGEIEKIKSILER